MILSRPLAHYDAQNEAATRQALERENAALRAQVADLSNQIKTAKFGLSVAPVAQQSAITAPTGGTTVDAQARTAIGSILTLLHTFGLTA